MIEEIIDFDKVKILSLAVACTSLSNVLNVPFKVTISGIILKEIVSVKNVQTEITISFVGLVFLDAMLCNAITKLLLINYKITNKIPSCCL